MILGCPAPPQSALERVFNFALTQVAPFWLDELKTISERFEPRGVGLCAAVSPLMKEGAPQRQHSLREVFNTLRWLAGPSRCTVANAAQ